MASCECWKLKGRRGVWQSKHNDILLVLVAESLFSAQSNPPFWYCKNHLFKAVSRKVSNSISTIFKIYSATTLTKATQQNFPQI